MISNRPQDIPLTPGVYFFKNSLGENIYIGKAGNLKNRLSSYFNKTEKDRKTKQMLQEATNVEWQELDSEIEALIVESEQIKFHEPKYNIMFRDNKQYSYVAFSDDTFPRIYITHQPVTNDQPPITSFIGPFTDAGALKSTLKYLRRIFPYCTCKGYHRRYCLNYHIGKCLGFCCLNPEGEGPVATQEQIEQYKNNICAIRDILNGRKQSLIKEIEKEMKDIAGEENFEKAIELRDRLEKIKSVFQNARIIKDISQTDIITLLKRSLNLPNEPKRIEGYDIANIQGKFATGSMVVFTDGNPDKEEYKKFKIRFTTKGGDTAMLEEVLRRRFRHPEWQFPDLIIVDGGKAQLNAAVMAIKATGYKLIANSFSVIALTKNEKHIGDHIYLSNKKTAMPLKKLPDAVRNIILQIDQESHRFAIGYYRKLHRKSSLGK